MDITAQDKLQLAMSELNNKYLEREMAIAILFVGLIAGGNVNIYLYGDPGVAKSELARDVAKTIGDARFFDIQLHQNIHPDEIFGQPSLSALKLTNLRVRDPRYTVTESDIAFFDEAGRCGSTYDSLMRLLAERTCVNPYPQSVPLRLVIGASNTIPDDEEMMPFFDRFAIKYPVAEMIKAESIRTFIDRIADGIEIPIHPRMSLYDLDVLKEASKAVIFEDALRVILHDVITTARQKGIQISTRRVGYAVKLLKTYALVEGESKICVEHLHELLPYVLWVREESEIDEIRTIIQLHVPNPADVARQYAKACQQESEVVETIKKEFDAAISLQDKDTLKKKLEKAGDRAFRQFSISENKISELLQISAAKNPRSMKRALKEIGQMKLRTASFLTAVKN